MSDNQPDEDQQWEAETLLSTSKWLQSMYIMWQTIKKALTSNVLAYRICLSLQKLGVFDSKCHQY